MHSIAINHGIIFVLHTISAVFLFTLLPNADESIKDAMTGNLGYDMLTLSSKCPESESVVTTTAPKRRRLLATTSTDCSLVRTETHEDVWTDIDIIMVLAINEAIAALSHLIGFVGWYMSEASWKADSRHLEVLRRQVEYGITAMLLEIGILLVLGADNLYIALFVVFGNICIQVLGYMIERSRDLMRQLYMLATGTLLLLPIIVLIMHHADKMLGMHHAMTLAVLYMVLYLMFAIHLGAHIMYQSYRSLIDKDHGFQILGAATKLGLTWLSVSMLHRTYDDLGLAKSPEMNIDQEGLQMGLLIGTIVLVVVGMAAATQLPKDAEYQIVVPVTSVRRSNTNSVLDRI